MRLLIAWRSASCQSWIGGRLASVQAPCPSTLQEGRGAGRRNWLLTAVALAALVALTASLFVWPDQGMPAYVDAIVMMNGPGDRLDTALQLGWEQRAPVLVISRGSPGWLRGLEVTAGGTGIVSQAEVALLRAGADKTGLTAGLFRALA